MVVVGQMNLIYLFEKKYSKMLYKHFVWLTEHIGNRTVPGMAIKNFDTILYAADDTEKENLRPELVITYGGHIISKRLKRFLRENPPVEHWHVSLDGEAADLFAGALTTVIEMDPFEFMEKIAYLLDNKASEYPKRWEYLSKQIEEPNFEYSEMSAIGELIHKLPAPCALHLSNSSSIRYAQLFNINEEVEVCANRGTNGIEGSMSSAIGYSVSSDKLNFLVIGDLSFFYDMNALWNSNYGCNIRIMMLNNGGGEIFDTLPGLTLDDKARKAVIATHKTSAEGWAKERGFEYIPVHNADELSVAMELFAQPAPYNRPMLMEVYTDRDNDVRLLKEYYHSLKQK
jgi:2-succinyl-5-enolpyruvyl-6-hydroxy-3-cyclohexene-1-carboxylate synthase